MRRGRKSRMQIMAEAPRLAFDQTPEFKAAVAAEAQKAVAALKDQIVAELKASAPAAAPVTAGGADMAWISALAMEISQLTDQGTGRRRVAPEIMRQRSEARTRMHELIKQARADGRVPSYRLRNKVLLDEQLIDPAWVDKNHIAQPTEIDWPGVPNDAMAPINDTAKEIHAAFMDSIGSVDKRDQVLEQPLKLTKGGLVVKGAPSRAQRETTLEHTERLQGEEGLRVKHRDEPGRYKDVQILGSIAQPARQSI